MKDGSNQWRDGEPGGRGEGDPLQSVVFDFEDTGDGLSLLPLAARRALDVAGFRLSLEGWQSLASAERKDLAVEGGRDAVDASAVERAVKRSAIPATKIRPVPDPDPLLPPEQLSSFLGPRRAIDPAQWARLRALDRYALIHVLRRSIAHDDPLRLEAALSAILPRGGARSVPPERARAGGRSVSPAPGPRSPRRSPGAVGAVRGARRIEAPETERRSPPTSRSESSPPVQRAREVTGTRPVRDRPAFESEPPPRAQAMRSDVPPTFGGGASRAPRDMLDSIERAGRGLRAEEGRGGRAIHQLDDVPDHRDEDLSPDSLPPLDSDPPDEGFSSHLSSEGHARMVDVGDKPETARRATAQGSVKMRRETAKRIVESDVPKGDVLSAARIAGIMAAKRTPELVPLCHHVALTKVEVHVDVDPRAGLVTVVSVAEARDRTGVEMEALAAVTAACLTIYDMLKGVDRDMVLSDIKLLEKSGGRTGRYVRED